MLMTEQEARTKWCPHYRIFAGNSETGDNRPNGPFNPRCIASDCMAWRKENSFERNGKERSAYEREIGVGNTGRGYCGAFGKAEG